MARLLGEGWLTSAEVASVLRCHPKTVRNRLQAGTLPLRTVKFDGGRVLRINRKDFEAYLASGSSYTGSKAA